MIVHMSHPRITLLLTTDSGLEGVLEEELIHHLGEAKLAAESVEKRPFGLRGVLLISLNGTFSGVLPVLHACHSLHHIHEYIVDFLFPLEDSLSFIRDRLGQVEVPGLLQAASFRVSSKRMGKHSFDCYDVMRVAGACFEARFGTPVSLKAYTLNIRVDILEDRCLVAIQHTRVALTRRFSRAYSRTVSLKSSMAYALLHIAGIQATSTGRLLDPFCGAGTILLKAAQINPHLDLQGGDWSEPVLEGAVLNVASFGLQERITLRHMDARALNEYWAEESIDYIVTNPPFGLKLGREMDIRRFYGKFLSQAERGLKPQGKMVILVLRGGAFRAALRSFDRLKTCTVLRVEGGGKRLQAFVIEKRAIRQGSPEIVDKVSS